MSSVGGGVAGSGTTVRVVSYNILTPNYAGKDSLPRHPDEFINPELRYAKILAKLKEHVAAGAVICLQEICRIWAGRLHCWFSEQGYYFVQSCYGRPSSGYFGVGVAWPLKRYKALQVHIQRIAECKSWPRPPPKNQLVVWTRQAVKGVLDVVFSPVFRLATFIGGPRALLKGPANPLEDMEAARMRENTAIIVELSDRATNKPFVVSTYHMPCEYRRPRIMTVHTALLAQKVHSVASGRPYIITGDFNFRPEWPQYELLTKGWIVDHSPDYPILPECDTWRPRMEATVRSALAVKWGQEPDFTNYAAIGKLTDDRFIGTLDYILVSSQWRVLDAVKLMSRDEALKLPFPFPDGNEPSDHLLIFADLASD